MPDCSNENGTVLERQFLLRGLFAEILSGRALCHEERGPWPLGSRGDVVASPDLKSGSGLSSKRASATHAQADFGFSFFLENIASNPNPPANSQTAPGIGVPGGFSSTGVMTRLPVKSTKPVLP